jgi:hypothetical protein
VAVSSLFLHESFKEATSTPSIVEQVDLEGNHSYKFIYSGFSRTS